MGWFSSSNSSSEESSESNTNLFGKIGGFFGSSSNTAPVDPTGDTFDQIETKKPPEPVSIGMGSELKENGSATVGSAEARVLPSMESLHNVTHEIFPVPFEGVKMVLNQGLNQHFQLNYSWAFGSEKQSGFKFGATFVGNKKLSESEIYPIMLGELSPNGNLSAQIIHQFDRRIRCKYVSQMKIGHIDGQQFSIEHRSSDINLGLSIVNPSIENREISCVLDVMRKLTDRLALGSMFVFQRSNQAQFTNFGVWNVGGQFTGNKWTAAVGVRPFQSSFHSTFHMKLNDSFQIGTEIETSFGHHQCVGTAGYQYDLQKSGITIKSQIDSNWKIATSYERKFMVPIPFSFNICINGDFWKSVYGLGVGFSLL